MNTQSSLSVKLYIFLFSVFFMLLPQVSLAETVQGVIGERVIDNPDGDHVTVFVMEEISGTTFPISFDSIVEKPKSGEFLIVDGGFGPDGAFQVNHIVGKQAFSTVSTAELSSGAFKVATIIVNFADLTTSCSSSQLDSLLFTGTQSVRGQLETSSRGQNSLESNTDGVGASDIFGPFTISAPSNVCDPDTWSRQADAAATAAGVNLNNYDNRIYVLPHFSVMPCGWSGLGSLGCTDNPFFTCRAWVANCADGTTYVHELGHNYGMRHASIDPNNDGIIRGSEEYSDRSCPMGNSSNWNLFNAPHQDQMGWFDSFPDALLETRTGGSFTLAPLEDDPSTTSQPLALKIPTSRGEFYYISYRRDKGNYGEFSSIYRNNVSVHRYSGSDDDNTRLIANLELGESFSDPETGMTVEVTALVESSVTVLLSLPSNPPTPDSGVDDPAEDPEPDSNPDVGGADTDGDGVSDAQEAIDGTNSLDPGSFKMRLDNPVHTLWNGFLEMVNIIELVNPSASRTTTVNVELFRIDGSFGSAQSITIAPGSQFDLVLNSMTGFEANSYGVVRMSYSGQLDGRVSYYRSNPTGSYDFAYSVPLESASFGETAVGFNTFQPSQNGADALNQVYNWLTVVNLSSTTKNFTVYTYSQSGDLLAERDISLPGFGRTDMDGGHGLAGPSVVGLHRVVPEDDSSEYIAQLIRYGSNAPAGGVATGFDFAFPLVARAGNGEVQMAPISSFLGEENWVEVSNASGRPVEVAVEFFSLNGDRVFNTSVSIPAYGQYNFPTAGLLPDTDTGFARIVPSRPNSVIAQTMSYFRSETTGSMQGMFGSNARETLDSTLTGSYNLFLGMQNFLRVSNTSDSQIEVTIEVVTDRGTRVTTYVFPPRFSWDFSLHDATDFGTSPDTYGFVRVSASQSGVVLSELIRRKLDGQGTDFVFPTSIRP